jgi:hypothetical protein
MAKAALRPAALGGGRVLTLSLLKSHPEAAASLSAGVIPALVAELAAEQATLCAVQAALTARLIQSQISPVRDDGEDRLLTADEVGALLGVPKRWVQRRARRLPFARFISEHSVRYSELGLKRWLEHRRNTKT